MKRLVVKLSDFFAFYDCQILATRLKKMPKGVVQCKRTGIYCKIDEKNTSQTIFYFSSSEIFKAFCEVEFDKRNAWISRSRY